MLSHEVIVYAINNTSSPEDAASLIESLDKIRKKVIERNIKIEKMRAQTESEIQKLLKDNICNHPVVKRLRDPSGNSDSSDQCLVCDELLYVKSVRFT